MNIPVSDPHLGYLTHAEEIDAAVTRVLQSGIYILGPEVEAFEHEFAEYVGRGEAVGVASGTDAIALALRSLGVGEGDEVITVSHTAVATVAGVEQAGAVPVLIDVEPNTLTMDPGQLGEVLTTRTRAVLPVHLYGHPAQLAPIRKFCDQHSLALIEDASQAHGARYHGHMVGSIGDAAVFSCYPTKNLGALGDAGIATFADSHVAARARRLRQYGWQNRNESLEPGFNTRLDEVQAAVLRIKLRALERENAMRREIADWYTTALAGTALLLPRVEDGCTHVFHLYVVQHSERDAYREALARQRVASAIHYPSPVHLQPAYANRVRTAEHMTVTERAAAEVLSLPLYPQISPAAIRRVIEAVRGISGGIKR